MKNVKFAMLLSLCAVAIVTAGRYTKDRLEQAQVELLKDEAGQENNSEASIPGNGDENQPVDAITIASESELAKLDTRAAALLAKAEAYLAANSSKFTNKNYVTVVDFTLPSSQARMFMKDLDSGIVTAYHVAHGSGSDPKNTGYATIFSNVEGSQASSVGFFRVSETYIGKHGLSARLDGLSDTNSNVRSRAVVIHGAAYVYEADKKTGRSWGCFAVAQTQYIEIVSRLKGGSLLYAESK